MTWSLRRERGAKPAVSRPIRRALQLLVVLAIFNYLVIPRLSGVDFELLLRVNLWMVVLAVGLQVGKLVTYTIMTRAVVPFGRAPAFWTLFRIQLSTFAIAHVVPGGTAAGGVLGYRLLTTAGMRGTDAAFTMATQGVGSAVVLNVILWLALVASIPARGLTPLSVPAALLGILLIGGFGAAVVGLVRGEEHTARVMRRIAERLPFLDPERVEQFMRGVATRLQALAADRGMVLRATLWAAASWLLDAASLWVFVGAFGDWVRADGLLISFGLANVLAAIPVTPSGLGVVEGILIPTLAGFGAPGHVAALGVLAYRLVNFWLPIPIGGLAYLSLEVERGIAERRGEELRQLAEESMARADSTWAWARRQGMRLRRPSLAVEPAEAVPPDRQLPQEEPVRRPSLEWSQPPDRHQASPATHDPDPPETGTDGHRS